MTCKHFNNGQRQTVHKCCLTTASRTAKSAVRLCKPVMLSISEVTHMRYWNNIKIIFFVISLGFFLSSSCVGFKSIKETVDDPTKCREFEEELKTEEDWEYWNKVKKNNRDAMIIIDDTKR